MSHEYSLVGKLACFAIICAVSSSVAQDLEGRKATMMVDEAALENMVNYDEKPPSTMLNSDRGEGEDTQFERFKAELNLQIRVQPTETFDLFRVVKRGKAGGAITSDGWGPTVERRATLESGNWLIWGEGRRKVDKEIVKAEGMEILVEDGRVCFFGKDIRSRLGQISASGNLGSLTEKEVASSETHYATEICFED